MELLSGVCARARACVCVCARARVHACARSDSLQFYGLQPAKAPLTMGFPRQEYWSGLPFEAPGDLLDPGTESTSPVSPALAGRFFKTSSK